MNRCAFATPLEKCSGRPQWHHVIAQQRLKREFPHGACRPESSGEQWRPIVRLGVVPWDAETVTLRDILLDERNRLWLCSEHHEKVTNARLYVDIPESAWEFAREFGLVGMLENDLDRQGAA